MHAQEQRKSRFLADGPEAGGWETTNSAAIFFPSVVVGDKVTT